MEMITGRAESVITKAICNASTPITACNFTDQSVIDPSGCYRNDPEITCKPESVSASITSGSSKDTDPGEGLYIDTDSIDISLFGDTASMTRSERIEAALAAAEACRPVRCPNCGSVEIFPMFDPDMLLYGCADCSNVFVERT